MSKLNDTKNDYSTVIDEYAGKFFIEQFKLGMHSPMVRSTHLGICLLLLWLIQVSWDGFDQNKHFLDKCLLAKLSQNGQEHVIHNR